MVLEDHIFKSKGLVVLGRVRNFDSLDVVRLKLLRVLLHVEAK